MSRRGGFWQTRMLEVHVPERAGRFDSCRRHYRFLRACSTIGSALGSHPRDAGSTPARSTSFEICSRACKAVVLEMNKNCTKCGFEKPTSEFDKKGSRFQAHCKECRRAYWKSYYADPQKRGKHISQSKEHASVRHERLTQLVRRAKSVPCVDCKLYHPYWRMQFDHLPSHIKVSDINKMVRDGVSEARLTAEIAKCEPVCANCHADRTYYRASSSVGEQPVCTRQTEGSSPPRSTIPQTTPSPPPVSSGTERAAARP